MTSSATAKRKGWKRYFRITDMEREALQLLPKGMQFKSIKKKVQRAKELMHFSSQALLEEMHQSYSGERNPLYVWHAIKLCGERDIEFPEWLKEYLFSAAKRIADGERDVEDVLGFPRKQGNHSMFTQFTRADLRERAAFTFALALIDGATYDVAKAAAAKVHGSTSPANIDNLLRAFFPGRPEGIEWRDYICLSIEPSSPFFDEKLLGWLLARKRSVTIPKVNQSLKRKRRRPK
jgi:hypothetical protein